MADPDSSSSRGSRRCDRWDSGPATSETYFRDVADAGCRSALRFDVNCFLLSGGISHNGGCSHPLNPSI